MNFRIAPGDTTDGVLQHVRDTIGDDSLTVRLVDGIGSDPSLRSGPSPVRCGRD